MKIDALIEISGRIGEGKGPKIEIEEYNWLAALARQVLKHAPLLERKQKTVFAGVLTGFLSGYEYAQVERQIKSGL